MTPSDALAPGLSRLGVPVLLMNPPLSLATQVANNPWMEEMRPLERAIRPERAHAQFLRLYRHLSRFALVYLLPSTPGLQDQPYVSNLAVTLPHRTRETVIVSRFRSEPRVGETAVGLRFFALMNFDVHQPPVVFDGEPLYFEGEADLRDWSEIHEARPNRRMRMITEAA